MSETLTVLKKDGRTEPFLPEKVRRGIEKACRGRPLSPVAVEEAVADVIAAAREAREMPLSTGEIARLVLERLSRLDDVACLRFSAVYATFTDLDEQIERLKALL